MSRLARKLIEKEKINRTGRLDLGKCGLSELPEELFDLVWLEELILSNRYIHCDEDGFKKDKWIESINKGQRNEISEIPVGMKRLENLKKLLLNGHPHSLIFNFPQHIWKIKKLENLPQYLQTLDISFNRIEKIENLPPNLEVINLDSNWIETLENLPESLIALDAVSYTHLTLPTKA